ncbi:sulfate transporter CysZ [Litorivicinus lipolyticus]|jgi:CysZ protein|uniref:sulfate transporter CysZ n=1 Tax=Litorivicinus lipolyticus TaxID=418701 RepID=UPI003B5954A4
MNGLKALFEGFELILSPGLKRFVLVPTLVNLIVFVALMASLWGLLAGWVLAVTDFLPGWLDWVSFLIQPLAMMIALVLFVFGFTVINGFLAAPFYGILAEKVERKLDPNAALPVESLGQLVGRTLGREVTKWLWYLPRALMLLVFSLVPVINLLAPFAWFAFGAWVLLIEYRDYLNDNHAQPLSLTRAQAWEHPLDSLAFGGSVLLLISVPLLNLLIPSAAVAGATAWGVRRRQLSQSPALPPA